ncbi:DUF2341 domain-containing protein [Methanobacterium spitsbergense]|uniref:DUF2341 domain-containing protein n=1 Tax=Methanobacterium spitsbergense TaxID=2874285 RepID=A0A8T5UYN9_9EURY|nr:DUF2341 domain-containing protein [Methanobacterium spitsbergense]MBZ2166290.1 DUF2341 domain-containing protein [Methanobacterium spitsbergense]
MTDYSAWEDEELFRIYGSIDGILTNYPVNVKVFWKLGMASDFKDVRFSLNDTNKTNIPYFMTDSQVNGYANFILLIPSIPADPDSLECKVYYNNLAAISESDPDAVCILYDHFEGTLLDDTKWSQEGGTVVVSNSIATITNTEGNWLNLASLIDDIGSCILEMKIKKTDDNLRAGLTSQHSLTSGSVNLFYKGTGGFNILSCLDNVCNQSITFPDLDDYHILKMEVDDLLHELKMYYDNVLQGSSDTDVAHAPFRLMIGNNNSSCSIDYISVLKYTANPPADVIIGEEFKVPTFIISDNENNEILNLLFETMYPGSMRTKIIKIKAKDFNLRNIVLILGDLDPKLIPDIMQYRSVGSYHYIQLSEDDVDYYDSLDIAHLDANTDKEIYVKCTIPASVEGGNFMCGLIIQAEL